MTTLATRLNGLSSADARAALLRCCSSTRWVERVLEHRPFTDDRTLEAIAERVWWQLEPADWRDAFAGHPRIGEQDPAGGAKPATRGWSQAEQSGMLGASEEVRRELVAANQRYEERFGHVFLICATGLGADTMLQALRERLPNAPTEEIRIAAAEQAKITELRLRKLSPEVRGA